MSAELPRSFGTYTLLKLLARGGMGEIYLARTTGITGFEKYYAVKKLLKKFTHDNDVGARFIDEAKLGARLQHPNIVQVYDLGRVNDELYMATEFVDGFDLRRVLRFCHEKKKRIPLDIALFIVREILSGLAYAHRQVDAEGQSINLIHRDISPQNVLVSFEGEVKIIDFGLAKSTQRSQETQANVLLGNFGYMSPEQARGHQLDVRTDVYSAGIVLFELVTGTKRFVEENPLRLLEMVARPTPIVPSDRIPGSPKTIDKIYAKATAPTKEDRFESAEAFRDDVTTALHKINPKASRENLAQFLNHLFLGGAAPAPVDADALDKSVAVRVRDIYERSDAFQAPVDGDVKDRRLADFSDDAAQTASHPLMRQARAGDVLTHQQLTGEEGAPAVPPPAQAKSAPPPEPTMPNPAASRSPPVAHSVVPTADPADLVAVTSPHGTDLSNSEEIGDALGELEDPLGDPVEEAAELVVDLGPSISGTPTSVYDSPEWPGQLDRAAADAADPSLDVQRQIEEQARQLEAQQEVQRELEAQVAQQAQAAPPAAPPKTADKAPVAEPERPPRQAPPTAPPSRGTVVTTVGPPPKRPQPSQEQPSIVVSMDLEPSEPTVVGAQVAPKGGLHDVMRTVEVQPVSVQDKAKSGGGFTDGGVHESLIIDFEGEGDSQPNAPAGEPAPDKAIRPAAQPLGRRVQAAVAQPKRPTARTTGADESPGNTMPPPNRRRS